MKELSNLFLSDSDFINKAIGDMTKEAIYDIYSDIRLKTQKEIDKGC